MMRHAVKITLLVLGLGVLFWWGWSGNFIFKQGALFRLSPSESYYVFSLAGRDLGYTRRQIRSSGPEAGFSVLEESSISLPVPGISQKLRLSSVSTYRNDGRLASADVSFLNIPGAKATAEAREDGGEIDVSVAIGAIRRQKSLKLPAEGPVFVSGVVPWLSRQREAPLGKVLMLQLLDLSSLEFKDAELTVTDVTSESDELSVFKVAVKTQAGEASDWVDGNGVLQRQELSGVDSGLRLARSQEEADMAKAALAEPPAELPLDRVPEPAMRLLNQFLPGG
jgi:hypothetical protein